MLAAIYNWIKEEYVLNTNNLLFSSFVGLYCKTLSWLAYEAHDWGIDHSQHCYHYWLSSVFKVQLEIIFLGHKYYKAVTI